MTDKKYTFSGTLVHKIAFEERVTQLKRCLYQKRDIWHYKVRNILFCILGDKFAMSGLIYMMFSALIYW